MKATSALERALKETVGGEVMEPREGVWVIVWRPARGPQVKVVVAARSEGVEALAEIVAVAEDHGEVAAILAREINRWLHTQADYKGWTVKYEPERDEQCPSAWRLMARWPVATTAQNVSRLRALTCALAEAAHALRVPSVREAYAALAAGPD